MLIDDLQNKVDEGRRASKSLEFIKIELKEMLIMRALDFIYNSPRYSRLIFGGGTALRVLGKTNRLSEDLDMDYVGQEIDLLEMADELVTYFKNLGFSDVQFVIHAENKILTVKFPILLKLGLVNNSKNESDLLYLKIEIEKNRYKSYNISTTPVMGENLFFVARHYDYPSLFANKIGAILGRKGKVFNDKYDFKGRDFYDLIWFLENKIIPNLERVKEILKKEQGISIKDHEDVWRLLRDRIEKIDAKGIYEDLKSLSSSSESIKALAGNYLFIFQSLVKNLK